MRAMVLVLLVVVLAGCSSSSTGSVTLGKKENPGYGTYDVRIQSFSFRPFEFYIRLGTIVRWTNLDTSAHEPTDAKTFDLNAPGGGAVEKTFDALGDFPYYCKLHATMGGKIHVV